MTGKEQLIKVLQEMGLKGKFDDLVKGETWNLQATFANNNAKRIYFYFWVTLRHSDTSTDMNQGIAIQLGSDDERRVIRQQLDKIAADDILKVVYEIAQGLTVAVWADSLQHLAPYGNQAFLTSHMIGGRAAFQHGDHAWIVADMRIGGEKVYVKAYPENGSMLHEFAHKDGVTEYRRGTGQHV